MTTLRFHGSAAVLLLPLALFVAVTARLFISEAAFDLTGLAAAGVLTLFSGSLLAKAPSEYWKAAVRGASSELTGTVVLILIASGIFSAMMKASGVADGLVFLGGMLHLTGHAFTVFVLLASSLMAAATGSSIGTLLAAMPIFFPAGVALGADPAMLAGAVLSGAIFGDNLAPVSDVTVISSVTQRFRNGTPADIAGVVRTRLPYAMIALAVSLPVYAFMGESLPVSEAALSGDASALLMLVPVAVLIAVAVRTRDVLMAISAGVVTGTATGLLIGRLSFATIFAAVDGRLSGFLISGISNVSPIILLCVTLFAFTGIVRDKIGRKMSKQLGNSPDPLDLIAQFGADGMRVAMLLSSSAGNDVMFDEALCEQGRNFGNKIWNAYRLVNGWTIDDTLAQSENNRLAIEWFRQALAKTLRQVESDFASYRISEAFMNLYKLFWDDFSGWYLEMIKPAYQCPIDRPTLEATCGFFDDLLRLLHPFMPFVTEEIWQDLAPRKAGESIMVQRMPEAREIDEALLGRFELTKEVVTAVRNVRKQKNIPQKDPLTLRVIADENYPAEYAPVLQKMGNLSQIETTREKDPSAVGFLVKTTQYFVPMEGMIDIEAERKKLAGELEYLEGFLASVQKKLSNERFVSSAPEKVVANERTKQADAEAKIAALREQLAALK